MNVSMNPKKLERRTAAGVCSGRGTCECGECVCKELYSVEELRAAGSEDESKLFELTAASFTRVEHLRTRVGPLGHVVARYTGKHCQYNDMECALYNNQPCGGIHHTCAASLSVSSSRFPSGSFTQLTRIFILKYFEP